MRNRVAQFQGSLAHARETWARLAMREQRAKFRTMQDRRRLRRQKWERRRRKWEKVKRILGEDDD